MASASSPAYCNWIRLPLPVLLMKMLLSLLVSVWTPWASWTKLSAVLPPSWPEFSAYGVDVRRFIGSISPSAPQEPVLYVVQLVADPATFIDSHRVSWFQSTLVPNAFREPRLTEK